MSSNLEDLHIIAIFEMLGEIVSVKVTLCPHYHVPDTSVKSTIIKFEAPDMARRAVSTMNGETVNGLTLVVTICQSKRARQDFSIA